jgi:predicted transcriptional regulator
MRNINTNQKMLISYLEQLQEAKLLEVHFNENSLFVTTSMGEEYLRKFCELQNIADFSHRKDHLKDASLVWLKSSFKRK